MAWWLAYEELYGDMDKEYPIMSDKKDELGVGEEIYEDLLPKGWDQPGAADTVDFGTSVDSFMTASSDSGTLNLGPTRLPGGMGEDHINLGFKPQPDLNKVSHKKYEEDKSMRDLSDYVTSTYQGHYTNKGSNVQTLDLIHSVGDAESFCRSNAIKYLSRYDKKGQAKRDILKAMHYCLLLYYFSGNTQEPDGTNTRYETF